MFRMLALFCCICVINGSPVSDQSRSIRPRIIGGYPIKIEDAPYQVAIIHSSLCGGSIISPEFVLTAAHCADASKEYYDIISGSNHWNRDGTIHKVVEVIKHEDFGVDFIAPKNDIALLKVSPAFEINNSTVKIVELFGKDEEAVVGQEGLVSGWGLTEEKKASDQLMGLNVKIIDKKICNEDYKVLHGITKNQICAVHPDLDKDFCKGDSGGPLVINGRQAGIVSWSGPGCARSDRPGVYTEISKYRYWIDKYIKV